MKNTDLFIILYGALLFSTVVALSLLAVERIDIYVALFAIEFFVASELTSPFGSAESRRKTVMGILLLLVFAGIVLERIAEILGWMVAQ
jgi:hypothetical protein